MRAWIIIGLAACSSNPKAEDSGSDFGPPPRISVPPSLRFGLLAPGEVETKPLGVANDGAGRLEIVSWLVEGEAFSAVAEPTFRVEPSDRVLMDVSFSPTQPFDNLGTLTLRTNDPAAPEVVVDLIGEGAVAELELEGPDTAFEGVFYPCSGTETFRVTSAGSLPVTLSAWTVSGAGFQLQDPPALPLTLEPGASVELTVAYGPAAAEPASGELRIESDAPSGPVVFPLEADGGYVETVVDSFRAPLDAPVDILFALDRSCSMVAETPKLAVGLEAFITSLEELTDDWQLAVVTGEDGCFTNGVLSAEVEDYATLFQEAVSSGETHGLTERLFSLAEIALNATAPGQCNEGFLRPDTILHLIFVSDEAEQSPPPVKEFLKRFQGRVADPIRFKASIIGDLKVVCGRGSGAARYTELADLSGGLQLDICDKDWSKRVADLALATVASLRTYPLTQEPVPDSLSVTVEGVPATDWIWDPLTNQISFEVDRVAGERIEVQYGVAQVCPE